MENMYTCPMHPEVRGNKDEKCPICGMNLVPITASDAQNNLLHQTKSNSSHSAIEHGGHPYRKLLIMLVLSFISMYILMYAMVDRIENVYPHINQFYMAALMAMPMVVIELVLMRKMYRNKKLNAVLISLSLVALIGFFLLIQHQTAVSDKQFLKGMIPHHAAALLMSEQAKTQDPEIKKLQQEIILSQQEEIRWMKAKLKELEK